MGSRRGLRRGLERLNVVLVVRGASVEAVDRMVEAWQVELTRGDADCTKGSDGCGDETGD